MIDLYVYLINKHKYNKYISTTQILQMSFVLHGAALYIQEKSSGKDFSCSFARSKETCPYCQAYLKEGHLFYTITSRIPSGHYYQPRAIELDNLSSTEFVFSLFYTLISVY